MDFAGRTICITGGTRGIGRALCDAIARRGAEAIIVVARSRRGLPESIGGTLLMFHPLDLSAPHAAEELARLVAAEHGGCSVLINNAGSQLLMDFVAPDAGDNQAALEREIALNFAAPIALSLLLMPILLRHVRPAICNITSGLALAPKQSAPLYCATKAGLGTFTRALRYQAQSRAPQLLVCEALPPLVDTEMTTGRGRGKISPERCARQLVEGMERERPVIDIGKTRLLRAIMRVSPSLGYRMLRDG